MRSEYAHHNHWQWVESNVRPKQTCSPLGRKVANIVGYVGGGIYNAPINHSRIDWENPLWISVVWRHGLCNWDGPSLSLLWVTCHRQSMRVEINPRSFRYIELLFHARTSRVGGISDRLPDVEEMVAMVDAHWKGKA